MFKLDDFLRSRNSSYREFYSLVTNTQMFTKFIAEHSLLPSNALNQSILINENLHYNCSLDFFDECCKQVQTKIDNNEQQLFYLFDIHDKTAKSLGVQLVEKLFHLT